MENTKTDQASSKSASTASKKSPVSDTLEAFFASPDFERSVIDATKAAHVGSGYSVELLPEKTWQVIENTQLGASHGTQGVLLELPILRVNDTRSSYDNNILHETFIETQEDMKDALRETLNTFSQR